MRGTRWGIMGMGLGLLLADGEYGADYPRRAVIAQTAWSAVRWRLASASRRPPPWGVRNLSAPAEHREPVVSSSLGIDSLGIDAQSLFGSAATLETPRPIIRAQNADPGLPPAGPPPVPPPGVRPGLPGGPPPMDERYNCGVVTEPPGRHWYDGIFSGPSGSGNPFGSSRGWFQSDQAFPGFISPVTNPFLFEDPRSLTEVRPILMYQSSPGRNPAFPGGSEEFWGVQGRLAFTDRWSLVVNKLGFVSIQPNNDLIENATGLAEINIGPKFTFLRNDQCNTLGAVGITFAIPAGPQKVFQNTGELSVIPYLSMGQNFFKTSWGSFNTLGTFGYSFGDSNRSDYFFTSLHLDYDIANAHRFYPLLELNWFTYTKNGNFSTLGTEGRDLINFGSVNTKGHNDLSIAPGFRYKFSECVQTGVAAEFPLNGARDLLNWRVTFDVIFRF